MSNSNTKNCTFNQNDYKIKPIVFDDFINPNHIVSLENENQNQTLTAENYILKAPKKGKIYKGTIRTAYKRTNLGSIPRKTEKILIDAINIPKQARGFSSQASRFSNKQENIKYAYPGPGTYKTEKNFDHVTKDNSHFSSKGFGNGFASNTSRFEDYKEFQDKFLPGPSSYKSDESTCLTANLNKTLSYKSLYNTGNTKTMKTYSDIPGPGHYNPIKAPKTTELDGENHYFKSDELRFKKVPKSALGPGKYFNEENDLNLVKSPNKGRTYINTGGKLDLNGNKTQSYFFKCPEEKKENLIDKLKIKDDASTRPTTTPGPGEYEVKRDHLSNWNFNPKERRESIYFENIRQNKIKKRMQTASNKMPKPLIEMNLNAINNKEKEKNNKMNKTATKNMFVPTPIEPNLESGILGNNIKPENMKKFPEYLIKRNTPGPAYYKPLSKPLKVNFNWNLEKNWI